MIRRRCILRVLLTTISARATQESVLAIRTQGRSDKYLSKEVAYKGCRLVVSYCPKLARKHRKEREAILKKLREETDVDGKITAKKMLKNAG